MFQFSRRQQLIILLIAAVIVFGVGYRYALWQGSRASAENGPVLQQFSAPENNPSNKEIVVHVIGAVERPGVYRFSPGARVEDAVNKAIARPEADLSRLNLAAPLVDGKQVMVPEKQVAAPGVAAAVAPGTGSGNQGDRNPFASSSPARAPKGGSQPVNINTADQKELETLPGIGPSLAQRIIQYRETNGGFKVPEDIKNVSGIGDKRYEQLKDLIVVY
ncbi:ComEA family DNA-binding protein [Desulfofundulus thermobenzoicus]|uniref:ComEA family DNA-binding protein n=1 Tax=Desulfofundulus thermobenzoicus TaxID=29376 RepID=A0A6N7IRW8_9FIRM|nr:ComEA family DNA-binding protein [Desulfofundulus thermobenzoicus]MQL52846.1 ComEA family DNA-binding protein [Desulfofundulus thermobenzoicus]